MPPESASEQVRNGFVDRERKSRRRRVVDRRGYQAPCVERERRRDGDSYGSADGILESEHWLARIEPERKTIGGAITLFDDRVVSTRDRWDPHPGHHGEVTRTDGQSWTIRR